MKMSAFDCLVVQAYSFSLLLSQLSTRDANILNFLNHFDSSLKKNKIKGIQTANFNELI